MKALWLILVAFTAFSCVTERACIKKYPPALNVKIDTIYRDRIVPVVIPGTDTIYKYGTILDTVVVHSGTAGAKTYVIRDTIKLLVWQNDSTYLLKIDSLEQIINSEREIIHYVKEKPGRAETILWMIMVIVGLVLLIKIISFVKD